jgi:hypothetical protein
MRRRHPLTFSSSSPLPLAPPATHQLPTYKAACRCLVALPPTASLLPPCSRTLQCCPTLRNPNYNIDPWHITITIDINPLSNMTLIRCPTITTTPATSTPPMTSNITSHRRRTNRAGADRAEAPRSQVATDSFGFHIYSEQQRTISPSRRI